MSRDIPDCPLMWVGVQSPVDHHCCCRREAPGPGGRRRLRRVALVDLRTRCPLPRRGRLGVRATLTPTASLLRTRPQLMWSRSDCGVYATNSPWPGSMPAPATIRWHLQHHHEVRIASLDDPPTSSEPLAASLTNHKTATLQLHPVPSRTTQRNLASRLHPPPPRSGSDTEILTWLDDHSRYALSVTAHHRVTGPIVVDAFTRACDTHGTPASTLTDNGMVFTTRLSGGKGGRNGSRPSSTTSASDRRTPVPTTPPPAAKSNASNRP